LNEEGLKKIKSITDIIVKEAIARDLVGKPDLARSQIQFDRANKSYYNKNLNIQIISMRKQK